MGILGWLRRPVAPAVHDPRSVIRLEEVERTPRGLVIRGSTGIVPPGLRFQPEVRWINDVNYADSLTNKTAGATMTDEHGRFEALLECYGHPGFAFPAGRYVIHFFALFNPVWQTPDFTRAVGVAVDGKGRALLSSEPELVGESPDLVKVGPERRLDATRIVTVKRGLNRR
jgi:hypothetical protein